MSTTKVKKLSNGYSYKYSDLATIHDELEKQEITYSQEIKYNQEAQADYIWTTLVIEGEKQAPICGCRVITGKLQGGNPAQEQGSALTYARRYSLLMALGWATEDDDAASVGTTPQQSQQKQHYQGHADGRLDFDSLKSWLEKIDTVEEVKAAKEQCLAKYPKMTEKQRHAVDRIFATRIENIEEPNEPKGWHEAIKV